MTCRSSSMLFCLITCVCCGFTLSCGCLPTCSCEILVRLDPDTGLKFCPKCKESKTADNYSRDSRRVDGLYRICKACRKIEHAAWYQENSDKINQQINERRRANPQQRLLASCRWRAREKSIPCSITLEDIPIPDDCPLCGRRLAARSDGKRGPSPNSPSIDKYVPSLGYVPGNVWIICNSCNQHKNDMSGEELLAFAFKLIDTFKEYCERMA